MNLSEPFIRRPVATSLITASIAMVGIVAFPFLPVAPLPHVDFPTINVTATLAGASPETMASSVAAPLERQFGQIPGVTQLTSTSTLGVANVVIQFDLNRNIDLAGQDVQAAITAASRFLPQAMTIPPVYRKVNPADAPIMMLWAHSERCRFRRSTTTSTMSFFKQYRSFPASRRPRFTAIRSRRFASRSTR